MWPADVTACVVTKRQAAEERGLVYESEAEEISDEDTDA